MIYKWEYLYQFPLKENLSPIMNVSSGKIICTFKKGSEQDEQ